MSEDERGSVFQNALEKMKPAVLMPQIYDELIDLLHAKARISLDQASEAF